MLKEKLKQKLIEALDKNLSIGELLAIANAIPMLEPDDSFHKGMEKYTDMMKSLLEIRKQDKKDEPEEKQDK